MGCWVVPSRWIIARSRPNASRRLRSVCTIPGTHTESQPVLTPKVEAVVHHCLRQVHQHTRTMEGSGVESSWNRLPLFPRQRPKERAIMARQGWVNHRGDPIRTAARRRARPREWASDECSPRAMTGKSGRLQRGQPPPVLPKGSTPVVRPVVPIFVVWKRRLALAPPFPRLRRAIGFQLLQGPLDFLR
jgi:hypothetical protein